jgi:hypothetical protein
MKTSESVALLAAVRALRRMERVVGKEVERLDESAPAYVGEVEAVRRTILEAISVLSGEDIE